MSYDPATRQCVEVSEVGTVARRLPQLASESCCLRCYMGEGRIQSVVATPSIRHTGDDRPADDAVGERIEHHCAIHPALADAVLGDGRATQPIRRIGAEAAVDQIPMGIGGRVPSGFQHYKSY